jgi:deazaflavin-dependent oxidoreductase (nitroreductase family)
MNREVRTALAEDQVIDITTNGRQSGRPRRIEIGFHNLDGRIFVTGTPGPRSWYANLLANPDLTFHLKRSTKADLPARARAITDEAERRAPRGAGADPREPRSSGRPRKLDGGLALGRGRAAGRGSVTIAAEDRAARP